MYESKTTLYHHIEELIKVHGVDGTIELVSICIRDSLNNSTNLIGGKEERDKKSLKYEPYLIPIEKEEEIKLSNGPNTILSDIPYYFLPLTKKFMEFNDNSLTHLISTRNIVNSRFRIPEATLPIMPNESQQNSFYDWFVNLNIPLTSYTTKDVDEVNEIDTIVKNYTGSRYVHIWKSYNNDTPSKSSILLRKHIRSQPPLPPNILLYEGHDGGGMSEPTLNLTENDIGKITYQKRVTSTSWHPHVGMKFAGDYFYQDSDRPLKTLAVYKIVSDDIHGLAIELSKEREATLECEILLEPFLNFKLTKIEVRTFKVYENRIYVANTMSSLAEGDDFDNQGDWFGKLIEEDQQGIKGRNIAGDKTVRIYYFDVIGHMDSIPKEYKD
jgi:hypothetical protein